MLTFIKKLIPPAILNHYHKSLAVLSAYYYGRPSEKMVIIGVTGTNGKTSTSIFIADILEAAGFKTALATTAIFRIGEQEKLNASKMTMLGRFALQKFLADAVSADCRYAVIETSSQGIEQFRHLGIHYDVCVFTNLTPEHIEAHGGFENYKQAKLKLFQHLANQETKKIDKQEIKKTIVVNGDDKFAQEFSNFKVDQKLTFGITCDCLVKAEDIVYRPDGLSFKVGQTNFDIGLFGKFNIYNTLAAIAVAQSQQIESGIIKSALEKVTGVPGRMEFIKTGKAFKVLIDYAPEPESMRQLFETIKIHHLANGKIIHVFGSCGGGRDEARRPILGELSAQQADMLVITNEDPYDDDPQQIIDQVAAGAASAGKILNKNLFKILDRREAIKFALAQAQSGDLALLTGKGCEQAICVKNNCKLKWDEREVVRELLA